MLPYTPRRPFNPKSWLDLADHEIRGLIRRQIVVTALPHIHVLERARGGDWAIVREAKLTNRGHRLPGLCVRRRLGHGVSLHDPEEMMAERATVPARVCSSRSR